LVRRLWESQEVVVSRLMRVRYGPVVLPERLKAHTFYELTDTELDLLFEFAGLKRAEPTAKPEPRERRQTKPENQERRQPQLKPNRYKPNHR
jgi:23S rRNA pseudouridine2605 synthase